MRLTPHARQSRQSSNWLQKMGSLRQIPPRVDRTRLRLMDALTLFGLFVVTAMLVFYALEDRSPWFILAFGGACALG